MNQDQDKLLEILEQATAPRSESVGRVADETASLREGWLAFGQLLAAAEPKTGRPLELPSAPPAQRRGWHLAVVAAVAASLVIGVAMAWRLRGTDRPVGPSSVPDNVAVNDGSAKSVVLPVPENRVVAVPSDKTTAPAARDLKWDDKLDDEIAQAGQEVIRMEQQWAYRGDTASFVQYGLEQVEEDVKKNEL